MVSAAALPAEAVVASESAAAAGVVQEPAAYTQDGEPYTQFGEPCLNRQKTIWPTLALWWYKQEKGAEVLYLPVHASCRGG